MITSRVEDRGRDMDSIAKDIGNFLNDHKCGDVKILDVRNKSSWTDYLCIATVSSSGHLRGVLKHLHNYLDSIGVLPRVRQKKIQHEDWIFIDSDSIVFHIMKRETREFYQIEQLWFDCKTLYSS